MQPLISVIVPVYNTAIYLPRCVASLQAQTLQAIEIILIDDGSTDESAQLCDAYAQNDKRIVVLHTKNGGQSAARNLGIAQAKGAFIAFVDSDDSVLPDMYKTLLSLIQTNDAQAALCGLTRVLANGKRLAADCVQDAVFSGKDAVRQGILLPLLAGEPRLDAADYLNASVCRGLYAHNMISENKLTFSETSFSEDLLFNLDFFAHCTKAVSTEKPFYLYYDNPASTTTAYTATRFDTVCALYRELMLRYPHYHLAANDALPRIGALILGQISVCMKQEVAHNGKRQLLAMCNAAVTEEALQLCKPSSLFFPLSLFCFLIKHRQIFLLTLLIRIYLQFFNAK